MDSADDSMSGNAAIVIEKKDGEVIYLGTLKAKEFEQVKDKIAVSYEPRG